MNFISRPSLQVPAAGLNANEGGAHAPEVTPIFYPPFSLKTGPLLLRRGEAGPGEGRGLGWALWREDGRVNLRGREKMASLLAGRICYPTGDSELTERREEKNFILAHPAVPA